MTALSADRLIQRYEGDIMPASVVPLAVIYGGSLVTRCNACGIAARRGMVQAATDACGMLFAGVARTAVTGNASGATAAKAELYKRGVFRLAFSGTATIADEGKAVYIVDDQTVGLAATTTYDKQVGVIDQYVSANVVDVRIDGYAL